MKRIVLISTAIVLVLVILIIAFISPITKYLIQKYDLKYLGREVTLDWAYVNPFTGHVYLSNVKVFEPKSDSILFSSSGLTATISIHKLFSKSYEISEIVLDEPKGRIIQHKKQLNFDDLIERFTPAKKSANKEPVHFSILSIKVNNGEFYFNETEIPINYYIKKVNCESSGFRWNADTIAGSLSLLAGKTQSNVKGDFTINYKTLDYRFAAVARKLDLEIIDQYLKQLVDYGTFRATIDADLKATGNFKDEEDIKAKGILTFNDMHFGKDSLEDYASFDKLIVDINELSPKYHKYDFDSLWLSKPYFKYERYDYLDNLQTMFGEKGENIKTVKSDPEQFNLVIEIARYAKVLVKNFFRSSYKINKLAIVNGDFRFNDYAISEKFAISASPLFIQADSVDRTRSRVKMFFKSGLQPYGAASIDLSVNPRDSSDFDLNYHIEKIPAALFNPYLVTYTSYPLDRGTVAIDGRWHVQNGLIQSTNHLLVIDPRLSDREKNKDKKWLPMPLLLSFVRERGNVIDYEIPISGNLKDPKFHLRDVIVDLVENIFIKPVTIPYGIHVKSTESEIEKSLSLNWKVRSNTLESNQDKFVQKISDFLKANPGAALTIRPISYADREKEQLLFFEAKKKYFLLSHKSSLLTETDSVMVDKMSVKDTVFVHFMDKYIVHGLLFTIQKKCSAFVNTDVINFKYNQLLKQREELFRSYFLKSGTEGQIQILSNENGVPYNGFSFYKMDYKGDIPESLIEAYRALDQLDVETPRKRYFWQRKKIAESAAKDK